MPTTTFSKINKLIKLNNLINKNSILQNYLFTGIENFDIPLRLELLLSELTTPDATINYLTSKRLLHDEYQCCGELTDLKPIHGDPYRDYFYCKTCRRRRKSKWTRTFSNGTRRITGGGAPALTLACIESRSESLPL